MTWVDQHWGLVLVVSGVLGLLATLVGLRLWAVRAAVDMEAEVLRGSLRWGAQVRQHVNGRTVGARGRLLVLPDGRLSFVPFSSDQKRGATFETWALDEALVTFGERHRDITGLATQLVRVEAEGRPPRTFAAAKEVGARPALWSR